MSDRGPSRRAVTIGGGIAAALGIAALGITVPRLFGRHYRRTPYDDLLSLLIDREAAKRVGQAAIETAAAHSFEGVLRPDPAGLAKALRQRMERRTLAEVTNSDLAQGSLLEVKGWVLPETLVMLSVLAARES
ncbi:MAG TPA: hypothetical protein VJ476_13775 [Rhizomicrobium sp.]|nr:hypothetical protein [Rhizomicrobium sp.]